MRIILFYTFGINNYKRAMDFYLGELFCGPGGLAKGAMLADIGNSDWRIIHKCANDYDSDTCQTYRNNICPDSPDSVVCEDVHTLDLSMFSGINAFAFGAPCNDFSIVGEQKGFNGLFGPLYSYGIKVLKEYHPLWFLFENVGGLKSANEGEALRIITKDMKASGYKLYPNLYKFELYGVPQARHRLIIVGIREDLPFEFRIPSYKNYSQKSCREAIENPPIPLDAANNELTKQSTVVVERLKYIQPGQNAWNAPIPDRLKLHVKGTKLSQIYRRLDPDKPSYTITGSGGGGTHVYHWKEHRA